ncbi:MAG: hypothetical protein HQ515_18160 [Phycisphaeraceae bacterium]|nr:hypothetical protein [Phycisphaeraceae bacterium]
MKNSTCIAIAVFALVPFSALLAAQAAVDPSGTWTREYVWNDAEVEEVLRLDLEGGKVVGTLLRNDESHDIMDGTFKGDEVSFSVSGDYQGNAWTTNYTGTIAGDEIKGTGVLQFGDESWDFEWMPQRSVQLDDVIGTWKFRIESEDGNVLEPTLKISQDGDTFKGAYQSMQGYDLEVKDLRVEKNALKFTLSGEYDGNAFKVDYQGRPYGDKISGSLEYDFGSYTGQSKFSGQRKSE